MTSGAYRHCFNASIAALSRKELVLRKTLTDAIEPSTSTVASTDDNTANVCNSGDCGIDRLDPVEQIRWLKHFGLDRDVTSEVNTPHAHSPTIR